MENKLSTIVNKSLTEQITEMRRGASIREAEPSKMEDLIIKEWAKTNLFCGQETELEAMRVAVGMVVPEIKRNYPHMKANELIIVFQEGRAGKFGEYISFNMKLLLQWILDYSTCYERNEAVQAEFKQKQEQVMSKEERTIANLKSMIYALTELEKQDFYGKTFYNSALKEGIEGLLLYTYNEAYKRGYIAPPENEILSAKKAACLDILQSMGIDLSREENKAKKALNEIIERGMYKKEEIDRMPEVHQKMYHKAVVKAKMALVSKYRNEILSGCRYALSQLMDI